MANLTYLSSNRINDRIFGSTAMTPPTTYYLGISTTTIAKDGTGITEPTDGAYARIAIANNKTNFSTAVLGIIDNLVEFQFPESTVSWGIVTDWFLSNAVTAGDVWFEGELNVSRNVEIATVLVLPVGSFSCTAE